VGQRLGKLARPGDVLLLVGELGAGKTCLAQGIAWGLDIADYAASPSFVLVREYQGRLPFYHIDLYRLDSIEEVVELGLDEYLCGKGVCAVEWADKALAVLPGDRLLITMEYLSESERQLRMEPKGARYREMLSRLKEALTQL